MEHASSAAAAPPSAGSQGPSPEPGPRPGRLLHPVSFEERLRGAEAQRQFAHGGEQDYLRYVMQDSRAGHIFTNFAADEARTQGEDAVRRLERAREAVRRATGIVTRRRQPGSAQPPPSEPPLPRKPAPPEQSPHPRLHPMPLEERLQGAEAQRIFAEQGEEGYLQYVMQDSRAQHSVFSGWATRDAQVQGPDALKRLQRVRARLDRLPKGAPGSYQPVVPAAKAAQGAPARRQPPSPTAAPPPAPKPPEAHGDADARQRLAEAEARYAKLLAEERSSNLTALLGGSRAGRIARRIISPIAYPKAIALRKRVDRGGNDYFTLQKEYLDTIPDPKDRVHEKLRIMANLEQRVTDLQVRRTRSVVDADGNPQQTGTDRRRTRLAQRWLRSGNVTRAAMVAGPMALLGLGAGVGMAFVEMPLLSIPVGLGIGTAGRLFGTRIANTVNRYKPAVSEERDRLDRASAEQLRSVREAYNVRQGQAGVADDPEQIDARQMHTARTGTEVKRNHRTVRFGEGAGMIGGGVAYAAGHAITSALLAVTGFTAQRVAEQPTATATPSPTAAPPATPGPHPSPSPTPSPSPSPTPTHPPTPTAPAPPTTAPTPHPPSINFHQYPWSVAHQLYPGHEQQELQYAINAWNNAGQQVNGGLDNLYLQCTHGNLQVFYGQHHFLSPDQQYAFNQYMAGLPAPHW